MRAGVIVVLYLALIVVAISAAVVVPSVDYWLFRYQSLLTGFAAVSVAFLAMSTSRTQARIMAEQQNQAKAQAALVVAQALRPIRTMADHLIRNGPYWTFPIPSITLDYKSDEVLRNAVIAHPERVDHVRAALDAAVEFNAAGAAIQKPDGYTHGTIWMHREGGAPQDRLEAARTALIVAFQKSADL